MRFRVIPFVLLACTITGCSSSHQSALVTPPRNTPFVRQNGNPVQWRQFSCGQPCGSYSNLVTVGGNMWFSSYSSGSLVQMTMKGTTTNFPLLSSMNPTALTVGSDGKLYAGAAGLANIDIMTTTGAVSQKPIPSGDLVSYYAGMTQGPDKNVWFVERGHIGRITTAGAIKEFAYADATATNYYGSITTGPDSNLWVTE